MQVLFRKFAAVNPRRVLRGVGSFAVVLSGMAVALLCHAQSATTNAAPSASNVVAGAAKPSPAPAGTNAPAATNGSPSTAAPSPFADLDLHSTFPVASSNLAAVLAQASSNLPPDLAIIVQTNIAYTTNTLVFSNANAVVVITNTVPSTNLLAVVTNAPPPPEPAAAPKPAVPTNVTVRVFPSDKEVLVVATEDCNLMSGPQKLAEVPGLTVLVMEGTKAHFANVILNGTNGWVPLDKCIRIGCQPPEAEIFCRTGLDCLSSNDSKQAGSKLYVAAALEPTDRAYLSFYKHLTQVDGSLAALGEQYASSQRAKQEAERKEGELNFLKQKGGGLKGGGLDSKAQALQQKAIKDKEDVAKAAKEEFTRQQAKLDQDIKALNALFSGRIEGLKTEGLVHMAIALADYKQGLLKNERYKIVLTSSTNFVAQENVAPLRPTVSGSCAQYEAAAAALSSNLVQTASRTLDASLKIWPQNKIAKRAKEKVAPVLAQIEQLRKKTQQLKQEGDLIGLEIAYGEIGAITKDYEKLDELIAQNRKTLIRARELVTTAAQRLAEDKPFECQDLLRQAQAQWKTNPEIKPLYDQFQQKCAAALTAVAKIPDLEKAMKYPEIIALLQPFTTNYAKDTFLIKMQADFRAKETQRLADMKKAQALEKEGKRPDAFLLYLKWSAMDHARRLGRALGKEAETKGEKDKAIKFYEQAGLTNDVQRLRPAGPATPPAAPPAAPTPPAPPGPPPAPKK